MAVAKYKSLISRKVSDVLKSSSKLDVTPSVIEPLLNVHTLFKGEGIRFQLQLKSVQNVLKNATEKDLHTLSEVRQDEIIHSVSRGVDFVNEPVVVFDVNKDVFVNEVLSNRSYFRNLIEPKRNPDQFKSKVVVDFSSPNIAKPFHVGHFRSTIIGNYISNLYKYKNHDVVRLNYLGDWGTQFGILQVGLKRSNISDEELSKNPIELLHDIYVGTNSLIEKEPTIRDEAKAIFNKMEFEDNDSLLQKWNLIKGFTVKELESTYGRLGINFDVYDWESNYSVNCSKKFISELRSKGVLSNEDGKEIFKTSKGKDVPVLKSDGSSLYVTRDIAAAMDRRKRFNVDELIYVVDSSQQNHFHALDEILVSLDDSWRNKVKLVRFGRIKGMSTRKGEVVLLKDILDDAQFIASKKRFCSRYTKGDNHDEITDTLGISAVIVNDLKQRRAKDYDFEWNSAVQIKGDTGIKLQYNHCRLISLEEKIGLPIPYQCDASALTEPLAMLLIQEIARFDEVVDRSYETLEPYVITNYLFKLCNTISKAFKVLRVADMGHIGSQRLLLFNSARHVLYRGMKILGLKPLNQM